MVTRRNLVSRCWKLSASFVVRNIQRSVIFFVAGQGMEAGRAGCVDILPFASGDGQKSAMILLHEYEQVHYKRRLVLEPTCFV